MNRSSLRAHNETQMQAAFNQRHHQLGVFRSSSLMKEKDEELALFLEMRNREKERNDLLLRASEELHDDAPLGSNRGSSPLFNIPLTTPAPVRKTGVDSFLNSENDKNDYDWLLTPPRTPLFTSMEMEAQKTVTGQLGAPTARPTSLKSRLSNPLSDFAASSNLVSKQPASSPRLSSSSGGSRRPSSSGNPGSRPATPTGRPTLTTTSKSSRPSTPTSRAVLPSTRTMVATIKTTAPTTKPVVSATKTTVSVSKTTVVAAKPTVPSRSSTPLSRSSARSSTPTSRPTVPSSRSTSRASTPTRRPSTPSSAPSISAPSAKTYSSSKPVPVTSRQQIPSRGTSPAPTVRSRLWNPSEMPGFSLDAPPNLRTTLPERPLSATRGRPGAPTSRSSSIEPAPNGRPRRQSCSPSRGRSNGISHPTGSSMPAVSRGYSKVNDNVSPVVIGTRMVERVINMRKLAPPRLDDKNSPHSNLSGKSSSSPDSSGFGRSLSKKSLDMAIRHMDIRRRVPGNLRPSMTNIPASSMSSIRTGPLCGRTISVLGSPHATSSNTSSEVSENQNRHGLDSIEIDDNVFGERGGQSPTSDRGR